MTKEEETTGESAKTVHCFRRRSGLVKIRGPKFLDLFMFCTDFFMASHYDKSLCWEYFFCFLNQLKLAGGFKYFFMFTPYYREDSHFDKYFSELGCVTFSVYGMGLVSSPSGVPKVLFRFRHAAEDGFLLRLRPDLGGVWLF